MFTCPIRDEPPRAVSALVLADCPLQADGLRLRLALELGLDVTTVATDPDDPTFRAGRQPVVVCTGSRIARARVALIGREGTLVVVDLPCPETLARALDGNARVMLAPDEVAAYLPMALRAAHDGCTLWLSPQFGVVAARSRSGPRRMPLTERERDVWALLASGKSNEQIATELFRSPGTIRNTVSRIYRKLGVRSRAEAVIAALAGHESRANRDASNGSHVTPREGFQRELAPGQTPDLLSTSSSHATDPPPPPRAHG